MNLSSFHFRPQPLPTAAALVTFALFTALGVWQLNRAEEKRSLGTLIQQREALAPLVLTGTPVTGDAALYREIDAHGHYEPDAALLIENRKAHGRTGFHLVVPFLVEGGDLRLLVNRGWIADPAALRRLTWPDRVQGEARVPAAPPLELDFAPDSGGQPPHWPYLTLARYRNWSGLPLYPFIVLERGDDESLIRDWPRIRINPDMHTGYALQWFAFAAIVAIVWVVRSLAKRNAADG